MNLKSVCFAAAAMLTLASASLSLAQTNYYSAAGTEFPVQGTPPGNHLYPDVALTATNGLVVWEDNVTDGAGLGISAARLDGTYNASSSFRVNQNATGNQEHPRVAVLPGGGAVVVWQGGATGFQHIYARFLTANNTFLTTNDVLVSTFTNYFQSNPTVAVLTNGNAVVLWSSYNQAGSNSMQDVYGQIFTSAGARLGSTFLVNQFTSYNQRTPAVAALANGGFVATWVSEQQTTAAGVLGTNSAYFISANAPNPSIGIYARLFNSVGTPSGPEFSVSAGGNPCADPVVSVAADGSYIIAWDAFTLNTPTNGWDVYARIYTNTSGGPTFLVNTHVTGDQYAPRISRIGLDYFVTWTSLGQDGSREGVFGQNVHSTGSLVGSEFQVNSTTVGSQMQAVPASDGVAQFLVVWSGVVLTNNPANFNLFAQRYANVAALLSPLSAPFVWVPFTLSSNVYQPQLVITWPYALGLAVTNYEVYVDGAAVPSGVVSSNEWIMTTANGLTTNAQHSFQVDYVTVDGRRSPLSPSSSATTWSGLSWGGIPYEWMAQYFGGYVNGTYTTTFWPAANKVLGRSTTLAQVFLSGGNPLAPSTWLQQQLTRGTSGMYLSWNTQAGATYQVQVTTNFQTWSNVGAPRFAAGATDSIYIGGGAAGYYRIELLRQ